MKIDDDIVKLNFDARGQKWMMAKNMGTAQGPGNYPGLEVEKGNTGEFTFWIQNPDDVTFADPAFVPKTGKTNPGDFNSQLKIVDGGPGHNFMVIESKNSTKQGGVYHYELRFSNGKELDPIITNNGCCRPFYQSHEFLVTGGVLTLALFGYLLRRLVNERRVG